jgi:hypothetical protein
VDELIWETARDARAWLDGPHDAQVVVVSGWDRGRERLYLDLVAGVNPVSVAAG